jgi:nucleotide-binding universal stress UspA family protein
MILVPFDGSAASAHALDYACDFAKLLGTEIHVCHAIDYLSLPGNLSKSPESAPDFLREDGQAILAKARRIARKHELPIRCHLVRGNAAGAILRLSIDSHADLIVMGTHGRTGLRRLVLGSVAERVTRHSHLPVLLLRDPTYELAADNSR